MAITKAEAIESGIVLPPGSPNDGANGVMQVCQGCQCVVFWLLLTLCEGGTFCDWCMKERGWERMDCCPPLLDTGDE
jgi:hypothetical protein